MKWHAALPRAPLDLTKFVQSSMSKLFELLNRKSALTNDNVRYDSLRSRRIGVNLGLTSYTL